MVRKERTDIEIQQRMETLEQERRELEGELRNREVKYRTYLSSLVTADDSDLLFRDEVLRWLKCPAENPSRTTIKDWLVRTVGEQPNQLSIKDLQELFKSNFDSRRLGSLRQYVAERKKLVRRIDGKLELGKEGIKALKELKARNVPPPDLDELLNGLEL